MDGKQTVVCEGKVRICYRMKKLCTTRVVDVVRYIVVLLWFQMSRRNLLYVLLLGFHRTGRKL